MPFNENIRKVPDGWTVRHFTASLRKISIDKQKAITYISCKANARFANTKYS